jgi:hypothetical protein
MVQQGSICDRWFNRQGSLADQLGRICDSWFNRAGYVTYGSIGKALWQINWAGSMTVSSTGQDL